MQYLDLSDDEAAALVALLTPIIADDRVIPITGCSHLEEHSPSSDPSRYASPYHRADGVCAAASDS